MSDWTSFRVKNLIDKKFMNIITKWSSEDVEILVLREDLEPLKGQANMMTFSVFARNLDKSPEEYFKEITRELSGKDEEIEFSVERSILHWKKKAWRRGAIECQPVTNIINFSQLIMDFLKVHVNVGADASNLKNENINLKKRISDLERMLNEMIEIKNSMETELYKKFILLLNSKKKKTCEFKEQLKSPNSVYHESTDESENEDKNTLKNEGLQKSESSRVECHENIEPEDNICHNSIFHNISRAIVNNDPNTESLENVNYDSDESFVLKLSPSPVQRLEPKKNSRSIDEIIEDDSTQ